jgi:hypothetical protein
MKIGKFGGRDEKTLDYNVDEGNCRYNKEKINTNL